VSSKREPQRLQDIIDNIDAISEYTSGYSAQMFRADRKTVDACERCLERICEAAAKIGDARLAEIAPKVPGKKLRGFGNFLRHDYDLVDQNVIWLIIQHDLPLLRSACAQALGGPGGS
jgi:uncharacterized protein with HEPN domain